MGDIDIGADTLLRKAVQRELRVDRSRSQAPRPQICRAMSLQNGDNGWGHQSSPQKLLQLVGCRESKAAAE